MKALKEKTNIRVISDTIANDVYKKGDFWFIPQQSGGVRELPLKIVTFCYHPNVMEDKDFVVLEKFLQEHKNDFICYEEVEYPQFIFRKWKRNNWGFPGKKP